MLIRVPEDLRAAAKAQATDRGETMTGLVERAIRRELNAPTAGQQLASAIRSGAML